MEAEKDKNHPENQGHDRIECHEKEKDVAENAKQPETPRDPEAPKPDDGMTVNETKEEPADATDTKVEDSIETELKIEEAPPPDFDQASEEIDQFVTKLSLIPKDVQSELPNVPEVFEHFAFLVEANIADYDALKLSQRGESESQTFLKSVDLVSKLAKSLGEFPSESKYSPAINRTGGILHRAMCYLEDEFRYVLEDPKFLQINNSDHDKLEQQQQTTIPEEAVSSDHQQSPKETETNSSGYSDEALSKLNTLTNAMAKAGYEAECYQAYIVSRRTILENTLNKLGFEKLSLDEIQKMQWEPLEGEIATWNKTFKEFLSTHFPRERKLSEAVFFNDKPLSDSLFSSISLSLTIQLLNFAEAVAITKASSQKLFKFIEIYDTLRNAISTMDSLFPEETANDLKSEASQICSKLGDAMVSIFSELENSIKADTGKNNVPGGAVHPLTRYTLNYLKYACEYKDTLEQVFKEHQKNSEDQSENKQHSPFAQEMNKVMDLLDANLDSKSKLYKDNSLSAIFMMNNGRYILQKVKGSPEISCLMGDTWSRKRSSELRNYHKTYQRETWNRLLNCLSPEGLTLSGKVQKPVLKEKFKSFNAMFDEIHKTQSMWVVSDEQLQSELRVSISAIVIPAYRSFLARYGQTFTPGRQSEKYIKYQAEDIETYIDELFDGNSTPTGRKRP